MRRRDFLRDVSALGAVLGSGCATATSPTVSAPGSSATSTPDGATDSARVDVDDHDPWAALRGFCDGVAATSSAEYAARRRSVQVALRGAGVGAIVVEPGPSMTYLSGVGWGRSERPFLLVLLAEGEPTWLCPAFEEGRAREQLGTDAQVVAWEEHVDPFSRIELPRARVLVDADARGMIFAGVRSNAKGRKATVDLDRTILATARMHKTQAELARLRRANAATKAALAVAASKAMPGVRQSELGALIGDAQRAAGLQDVWVLCLFGPAAAFPHGTHEDRVLGRDDLVLVDTGGALHGYRSDITRTWPIGAPSSEARAAWETVVAAQRAALAAIRPGARCGDADAAARAVMQRAGHGADYETFTHRLGHGIGLQVHERPYLVRDNPLLLAPGMTMSYEPGIYVPGSYGVRIEDIVAVTEDGAEVFGPPVGPWEDPMAGHAPATP